MSTKKNTAIKVQTDIVTDVERLTYAIEEGSIVQTETGYWIVRSGSWVNLNSSDAQGLGWVRWDDDQYTSSNKLTFADGVAALLPNNGATITSYLNTPADLYNPTTGRVYGIAENDTYIATIVFKASAANANSTYGELRLEGGNGTPYERLASTIAFPRGNAVEHPFHNVFQYYVDEDFLTNGNYWQFTAVGGAILVWDIIFFIQRTQSR
jgi:hypothetical protein